MIIIDAPPGCSCPLVESIYGCDYCIIVTEPTPSGLHDIKAMSEILDEMDIPFGVILNKSENFDKLENKKFLSPLIKIPFSREIYQETSNARPFIKKMPEWIDIFHSVFERIEECI
ncbi:hypothetical protein DRN72_02485 [Methanosarcinales archaeon]|nr:MAG: hypothetical protein DRN72_02485 [Methanosarcinales archaeon]